MPSFFKDTIAARGEFDSNYLKNTLKDTAAFAAGGAAFGGGAPGAILGATAGAGWNLGETLYWRFLANSEKYVSALSEDVAHYTHDASVRLKDLNPNLSQELEAIGNEFKEACDTVLQNKNGFNWGELAAGTAGAVGTEKAVANIGKVAPQALAGGLAGFVGSLGVGIAAQLGIDKIIDLLETPVYAINEAIDSIRKLKEVSEKLPQKVQLDQICDQAAQILNQHKNDIESAKNNAIQNSQPQAMQI